MQLSGRDSNVYGVWVRGCMLLYKKENQPYRKKNTANMKSILLTAMMLLSGLAATAQTDPTIMTIDGKPVSRSEFEYSYNKNNSETVVDKKSVADYVDLFINYKLKVLAAEAAGIDTTESFRKEFLTYRDQQIRPAFIAPDDLKREAWKVYVETRDRIDSTGGMVRPAHILVMLQQKATRHRRRQQSSVSTPSLRLLLAVPTSRRWQRNAPTTRVRQNVAATSLGYARDRR